jgi:hypothetical protein
LSLPAAKGEFFDGKMIGSKSPEANLFKITGPRALVTVVPVEKNSTKSQLFTN